MPKHIRFVPYPHRFLFNRHPPGLPEKLFRVTPTRAHAHADLLRAPPRPPPCTNSGHLGIGEAHYPVSNGITRRVAAETLLTVDCGTYTAAGVTLTGPGMNLELPYGNGYISMNGTNYSDYITANNILFTTGAAYQLTSVTTSGTASASLVKSPTPSIATDGSTVTLTGNPVLSVFAVMDRPSNLTYESSVY